MSKEWAKRLLILAFLSISAVLFSAPKANAAVSMKVKSKLSSQTAVKISWSGSKSLKYWRIRRATVSKSGKQSAFKTIKTLKRTKKSYTVKKLKKNTHYVFEISGGKKVKGKYKLLKCDYIWDLYTGMSTAAWDDYAYSDAPCSPSCITLLGSSDNNGLSIKGFEIYRKKTGESKYKKIATVGKKGFPYKDKKVAKGATYKYKFRSYGTYKKKKLYSPWSEVMSRSAVNQTGTFQCQVLSRSQDEMVVKITSAQYNGALVLARESLCIRQSDNTDYADEPPVVIEEYSTDNTTWKTLGDKGSLTLAGGSSVYIKISPLSAATDLTDGSRLDSDHVKYNSLPSWFNLDLDGDGSAYMNSESIH